MWKRNESKKSTISIAVASLMVLGIIAVITPENDEGFSGVTLFFGIGREEWAR